jgi:hypothetical protein
MASRQSLEYVDCRLFKFRPTLPAFAQVPNKITRNINHVSWQDSQYSNRVPPENRSTLILMLVSLLLRDFTVRHPRHINLPTDSFLSQLNSVHMSHYFPNTHIKNATPINTR